MIPLSKILTQIIKPEKITDTANERFVTVKLNGGGAIERKIQSGKTPKPFLGYRVSAGQFIYSRIDARNGAFAIIPPALAGAVVSKDFPIFEIDNLKVDPNYFIHFMKSGRLESQVRAKSFGATNRQRIKEDVFLSLEISLPPLDEQRRVAEIFDSAYALQASSSEIVSKLDSLTNNLFLKAAYTDHNSPWPTHPIEKFVDSVQYGTSQKASGSGEDPILRMGNISDTGTIDDRDLKYIDILASDYAKYTLQPGDVLFNRTNSKEKVGKTAVVRTHSGFAFAGYLIRIRLTDGLDPEYLSAFMRSTAGRSIRQKLAKSAVNQANINAKEMQKILIPVPPVSLQKQFALSLKKIESQKQHYTELMDSIRSLTTALQSRAFRGEL